MRIGKRHTWRKRDLLLSSRGKYEGEYKNDKKKGKGIFYWNINKLKEDKYDGDWKNDKKEGKGILYFAEGDRYDGEFKNDFKVGNLLIIIINFFNLFLI